MLDSCCDSVASMDGKSLCDFFEVNLKGDLGDLGDLGLRGDLELSMKSCSSLTIVGLGSVSGCGVDFRAIVSPLLIAVGPFRLQAAAAGRRIADVSSAQPGYLNCVTIPKIEALLASINGGCEGVLGERQCFSPGLGSVAR